MRTEEEVARYEIYLINQKRECMVEDCAEPKCSCKLNIHYLLGEYEACIPKRFRDIDKEEVTSNLDVFGEVKKYTKKLGLAFARGYGLTLFGPNGVGKTMFAAHVLRAAISRGYSAYYTTLPQLGHNLRAGFRDNERLLRLEGMLNADFLCIDEIGPEQTKGLESYNFAKEEFFRVMKERESKTEPVILVTNMFQPDFYESYGESFKSIVLGNSKCFTFEPEDMRRNRSESIRKRFGFKS